MAFTGLKAGIRTFGIASTLRALERETKKVFRDAKRGLIESGFVIIRDAQIRCPVTFGNLRSSGYVVWDKGNQQTFRKWDGPDASTLQQLHSSITGSQQQSVGDFEVVIGFTAFYALYVHEDLQQRLNSGEHKYLQNALNAKGTQVVKIIKGHVDV